MKFEIKTTASRDEISRDVMEFLASAAELGFVLAYEVSVEPELLADELEIEEAIAKFASEKKL